MSCFWPLCDTQLTNISCGLQHTLVSGGFKKLTILHHRVPHVVRDEHHLQSTVYDQHTASLVRALVRAYAERVIWDGVWGWLAFPGPCMAGGRPSTCHFEQNVCESAFV